MQKAAELLSGAKWPVILNGAGVILSEAVGNSVRLAERLSAPVCCNYQHNDAFPGLLEKGEKRKSESDNTSKNGSNSKNSKWKTLIALIVAVTVRGRKERVLLLGDHPLHVGPLGYNGSKAAMELISKADVVLALGTRLNPFSTLPCYGIEYWPQDAKLIQAP